MEHSGFIIGLIVFFAFVSIYPPYRKGTHVALAERGTVDSGRWMVSPNCLIGLHLFCHMEGSWVAVIADLRAGIVIACAGFIRNALLGAKQDSSWFEWASVPRGTSLMVREHSARGIDIPESVESAAIVPINRHRFNVLT